jgi:hypothetical protein
MAQFGIDRIEMRSQPRHFTSFREGLGGDGRDIPSGKEKSRRAGQHSGEGEG